MDEVNEELRQLAALALRNAFWREFSALVNAYLAAGAGLTECQDLEEQLGEVTSVYGRNTQSEGDMRPDIWTKNEPNAFFATTGHDTLLDALRFERAVEVHLNGEKLFERRAGKWYFVE